MKHYVKHSVTISKTATSPTDQALQLGFHAIANPTRRAILELIRDDACTVTYISNHFAITRPAISQHLAVLRDAQLVAVNQNGTSRRYGSNPQRLRELGSYLEFISSTQTQNQ